MLVYVGNDAYVDTDEMSQEDYHEYMKIKKENERKIKETGKRTLDMSFKERYFLIEHGTV